VRSIGMSFSMTDYSALESATANGLWLAVQI
jgi:hypothetical protein